MAKDVFISYSHIDAETADSVCEKLEQSGIECWIAPRNIGPGDEWASAIMDALNACKIVLLIFSEASNASVQVLREIDKAVSLKKIIIPYRISDLKPTDAMDYYLSTVSFQDAFGRYAKKAPDALLKRVKRALAGKNKFSIRRARLLRSARNVKHGALRLIASIILFLIALLFFFTFAVSWSFRNDTFWDLLGFTITTAVIAFTLFPRKTDPEKRWFLRPWFICVALCTVSLTLMFIMSSRYKKIAPKEITVSGGTQQESMNATNWSIAAETADGMVYYADMDEKNNPVLRVATLEEFYAGENGRVLLKNVWADNLVPLENGKLIYRDYSSDNFSMHLLNPDNGYDLTLKKKTTSCYYRDRYGILYGEEGSISHGIGIITFDGDYDGNYIDVILYYPFYYQGHIYYLDNENNLRRYPDGSLISYDVNDYFIINDDTIYFASVSGDLFKAPLDDISNVEKLSDGRPSGIVVYKDWLYYLDTEDNYFLYRVPIAGGEAELVEARSYNAINLVGDCLYFSCRSGGYARLLLTDEAA
ncbi:MAG: TIR domain-containing protein [Oscillospiraceae bacterium]|nr:TIR domain-containing protein [Oscillospiraceae bacterium]